MRGTWKRGHAARGIGGGQAGALLPEAPDDLDSMDPDEYRELVDSHGPGPASRNGPGFEAVPPAGEPEPVKDPPAAKIGATRARAGGAPRRITAAVRNDVEGKFGLMLEMGGRLWSARDPVCGGVFVEQAPEIRAAAVELILLSPDLVQWFTGVGGGFMLWFNLLAALWPVAVMAYMHHIAHPDEDQAAGMGPQVRYAA